MIPFILTYTYVLIIVDMYAYVPRYPGTTFMDHVIRYHDDPNVKMMVVLGEVSSIVQT